MKANHNPSACGKCLSHFRPQSLSCRACKRYKAAHCAFAECPLAGTGDPRCGICDGPPTLHRSCTSCKWNGKGHPICWACKGPTPSFQSDGHNIVTLGALDDEESFIEAESDKSVQDRRKDAGDEMADLLDGTESAHDEAGVTKLPPEAEKPLLELVRIFASMTRRQVIVLHGLLNGKTASDVCNEAGFSKQNGSKAIQEFITRMPQLGPFIKGIMRTNRGLVA